MPTSGPNKLNLRENFRDIFLKKKIPRKFLRQKLPDRQLPRIELQHDFPDQLVPFILTMIRERDVAVDFLHERYLNQNLIGLIILAESSRNVTGHVLHERYLSINKTVKEKKCSCALVI
jgi:hypothetical protein